MLILDSLQLHKTVLLPAILNGLGEWKVIIKVDISCLKHSHHSPHLNVLQHGFFHVWRDYVLREIETQCN